MAEFDKIGRLSNFVDAFEPAFDSDENECLTPEDNLRLCLSGIYFRAVRSVIKFLKTDESLEHFAGQIAAYCVRDYQEDLGVLKELVESVESRDLKVANISALSKCAIESLREISLEEK